MAVWLPLARRPSPQLPAPPPGSRPVVQEAGLFASQRGRRVSLLARPVSSAWLPAPGSPPSAASGPPPRLPGRLEAPPPAVVDGDDPEKGEE